MNLKQHCNKCGKKGLREYRMAMMHGPLGYRSYAVCMKCAADMNLRPKGTGGKQRADAARKTQKAGG